MITKAAIATALVALLPIAANAGEVQNRINNQNARINQGVRSGSLTYGEYHRLDGRADQIQVQRNRDLRNNGGRLSAGEYRQLNREENHLSDRIYFDKNSPR